MPAWPYDGVDDGGGLPGWLYLAPDRPNETGQLAHGSGNGKLFAARRERPLVRAQSGRDAMPSTAANRRERAVSLFDNYNPPYQYRYHPHEVEAKFKAAGLEG
jgi:hypothetical protein